ncbi:beta-lactamase/transpeptidase-like protein [Coprinopsis sp. MPI-PUGE-AT-0042]|nr:beta-lactamase/transpeptidase-like protein [Coprinopsis sp. MPI-PUGE-AT-0042]
MRPLPSAIGLSLISLVASSIAATSERLSPPSGPPNPVLKPETVAFIRLATETLGIPGAMVAFTSPKGDGVLTFGNRTVDGDPVTPQTHFAIASNSKLFLGTILAWLAEKETRLDNGEIWTLDTPLKDFVPNFKMWDANATELATTLDFLAHRTGIPQHNFAINPDDTPKIWMERLAFLRPNSEFRSRWTYSNVNYAAITYVVELLTKKSYYDVLDEYIFKPLGMEASSDYAGLKASGAEISQGWLRQGINQTTCLEDSASAPPLTLPPSCAGSTKGFEFWTDGSGQEWGGGGNVIATGNDMVLWTKEILNPTHIPLSVFERVETPPFPETPYAFGTVQTPYRGYNMSLHDGALPGSNSYFARIRNESVGVFTLATDDNFAETWYNIVRPLVLDDLLDLESQDGPGETTPGGTEGTDPLAGLPGKTPRPESPRPAPEIETLVGATFVAEGYAPFTITSVNLSDSQAVEAARLPIDFLQIDVATREGLEFTGPILYAAWNQTAASYLVFSHFDGPLYNTTVLYTRTSLPSSGDESATNLGKYFGKATAVFVDGGIGFFDGFWSSPSTPGNLPAVEEGVEEAAEVFFARQ